MSKGGGTHEFPAESRYDKTEKKHFTVQVICCSKPGCTRKDFIRKTSDRLKPVSMLAEKFRQRGWDVGSTRSHDLCPDHAKTPGAKEKDRRSRSQRIAAYSRIHSEGARKPVPIKVNVDTHKVVADAKSKGVLAMADPVGEVQELAIDAAAEQLAGLGRVTRRAPPPPAPEPAPKPAPAPKAKPRLSVSTPMHNPPMGTEVFLIKDGSGGVPPRQTGWKPTTMGGSWSNVRKSARAVLGADAEEGVDFALFTDPTDDTLGWKPLRKPDPITLPPRRPPWRLKL